MASSALSWWSSSTSSDLTKLINLRNLGGLRAALFFLKDSLERGMSLAEIAGFLRRTVAEVREKAKDLKEVSQPTTEARRTTCLTLARETGGLSMVGRVSISRGCDRRHARPRTQRRSGLSCYPRGATAILRSAGAGSPAAPRRTPRLRITRFWSGNSPMAINPRLRTIN